MNRKIKYYSITNGHVVASWYILFLANSYRNISAKDIINIVEKSGKLGGTVPSKHGLKICLDYGLLRIESGKVYITEICESSILIKCQDEDPNIDALRALLYHILSHHNFEWLIFYNSDADIFRESVLANDPEWTNLLDNANLFDFEDEDVNIWWNRVLSKYEDYKEQLKKAIGDVGEKLTYHHELKRVETDGFIPPKTFVKWASRISDRFGFDVQSIRGNYFLSKYERTEKIQIEVKSSDTIAPERFRFFISKPEWNKALDNINSYFFYCWIGINIEDEIAQDGPFVIPAAILLEHVPKDNSEICEWSECRCIIDISNYKLAL
jgi:hypothetical protein